MKGKADMSCKLYIATALMLSAAVVADGDTCIVSGSTARDATAYAAKVLDASFDSASFAIATPPPLPTFNSWPGGLLINFR